MDWIEKIAQDAFEDELEKIAKGGSRIAKEIRKIINPDKGVLKDKWRLSEWVRGSAKERVGRLSRIDGSIFSGDDARNVSRYIVEVSKSRKRFSPVNVSEIMSSKHKKNIASFKRARTIKMKKDKLSTIARQDKRVSEFS